MAVEWKKELELGVEEIDNQHRELFKRFNSLLEACNRGRGKEEVYRVMLFLDDYIRSHFAAEEALQREAGYPEHEAHARQHREFVEELRKLEGEFKAEGETVAMVIRMNQLVVSWLIEHIHKKDRHLAEFLRPATA